MGKRVNADESKVICRLYEQHHGKWDVIMRDPDAIKLGMERKRMQQHISYKKSSYSKPRVRATPNVKSKALKAPRLPQPKQLSSSSSSSESEEEDEEFTLVSIKARKTGNPTKWYAAYSDGDERWVPESCFVEADGSKNILFSEFQRVHPDNKDVIYTKKRALSQPPPEAKKQKVMLRVAPLAESEPSLDKRLSLIEDKQKEILRLLQLFVDK